jgi:hypothetical protein
MLFPIVIKFAVALGVFWLISPRGKLLTAPRYGRRVAACFLVALIVAYPFTTYSALEWRVGLFMALFAWAAGFALGWLGGLIALRLKTPAGR